MHANSAVERTPDKRDIAVVACCSVMMFVTFLILIYVNVNRSYIPFKCKNIPLINVLFVSTLMLLIGDVYVNHSSLLYTNRPICIVTVSWLRISFGMYNVVCCYTFRVYEYICIFRWKVRATGKYLWIPLALWVLIPLIYGILASTLPPDWGIGYDEDTRICTTSRPLYLMAVAFIIILLLVLGYATFVARRLNSCFNEFRELLPMIFYTLTAMVVQVAFRWIPSIGRNTFIYNTLVTMTDLFVGQVSFYALVARPVYHCIVDREEYLNYFMYKLKQENLEQEYEMANGEHMVHTNSRMRMATASTPQSNSYTKLNMVPTNPPDTSYYTRASEALFQEPSRRVV
ncbi:hypothetical protein GGI12_000661 [Dipsacomyces acuminosporus]|nr:hypothetical protein GGI12_000661 [Dipsacomyces acuminosporus]